MKDSVSERIKLVIDYLGISTTQFAKSIDTAQSVIATMFSRGTEPSSKILRNIVITYDTISPEWLLTGKGSMLKSEQIPSIKERLAHFLEEEKILVSDFCKSIGMSRAYYIEMRGTIPESKLKNIMELYPKLSIEWLMTGEGKMIKAVDNSSNEDTSIAEIQPNDIITKPRIPYTAAAGSLTNAVEGITIDQCEQIPLIHAFPAYDFTIVLKGNSMEPKYEGVSKTLEYRLSIDEI